MSLFGRLFSKRSTRPTEVFVPFTAPIAPDERLFVIGDVHGCLDLLKNLIAKIDALDPTARIVCVGDYIDRGEKSAEVLSYLYEQSEERGERLICLKGNHEEMFLLFMEDPVEHGSRWLRYGGLQTVASFRVHLEKSNLAATRDNILETMGQDVFAWIKNLPLVYRSGNVAVTHAGASPFRDLESQASNALLWGHPEFRKTNRSDGTWIVFGHVIQDQGFAEHGVIATDTGAYATGRLTAAEIREGEVVFHTA